MPILRFAGASGPQLGVVLGDEIAPLDISLEPFQGVEVVLGRAPSEVEPIMSDARRQSTRLPIQTADILSPVPRPSKIIAIGLNYADHIAESGVDAPAIPAVFTKFSNSVTGNGDPIYVPRQSNAVDYEGELGVVIGQTCRHVPVARANEVIGGYTIVNDISVRDIQLQTQHWSLGKSFDSHCPLGPWVALESEMDSDDLSLRTWVNDDLRQDSNTRELVFGAAELIAHLSSVCTLYPGDIIATGTPGGVGGAMSPPRYLVAGDEVRVSIEGLGTLINPVVDEPADLAHIGEERLAISPASDAR
jgi:2-keto-4-pentenoate hydratase/2-oxohepta-3-ene-1,7-dioic acid hydratase in catechol pathway